MSGRETELESLLRGFVSHPTARSLPFGYGSTGDELAASLQVWNGMMVLLGAARFGPRRNASDPPRRLHLQSTRQLRVSKCRGYIIHPRVTCVNPARRKGLSDVVWTPSAELAAAGRWSYGNERCVGDLVTVLLHS